MFINPKEVYTTHIPLKQSRASAAVASLSAGASRLITLTLPLGLTDVSTSTLIYAMVDSGQTTAETDETNNLTSRTFTTPHPSPLGEPTCRWWCGKVCDWQWVGFI